jgi:hypothetical protein
MTHWLLHLPPATGRRRIEKLEDLPDHTQVTGFVYKITNLKTGKFYIGKKSLYAATKKKVSKTEIAKTKTRKRIIRGVKESDWKKYWGSSKDLKEDIKLLGAANFQREILELCCSKKYLAYAELAWQMKYEVLKHETYNGNILGRYYHRDMENCNCSLKEETND